MEIAITGHTGFVGNYLLQANAGQHLFHGIARTKDHNNPLLQSCTTWEQLSVADLDKVTAVLHLAGKAHDLKNTSNAEAYFLVNRDLTIKIFDLFLQSNARDFIYFSSVKAVADKVEGILQEDVHPAPVTAYGQSKQEAEAYLLSKPLPAGKRLFIFRPCMIHGPGNKGNLNLLYGFVKKGIPYPLAAFRNKRSFLSVDNLSYIVNRVISDESITSGVYNLADDESLSTNEVVHIISGTLQKKPRLLALQAGLVKAMARVGDVMKLPLNTERLNKLTESYIVSNNKIRKALGISALPVNVAEGLRKTIASFSQS
ncbi:MAG: NAD-dependent epimerase/dehydratase family protein [Chitinophaga sp.]|uniref:NAD-dependent epimerase/dehydratase family protein n=1 Tax=Chitinophaga sp. TaxID=1869181 RepID=UPI001B221909|nr:NAD-dependent epimerase/dehydratase family protein [Chitinophaga sp.]MBO9732313.1 NAD-dependent epimerase/dehydratase family protein [Chitinophaga sp.]